MCSHYRKLSALMNFLIFRVGVSAAEEFFDIDMGYDVEIQNGYINIIKMYPSVMKMDPELKTKIEIHKRNCRFSDEIPQNMTMFNQYSASACKFDCMMRYR